MDEDGNAGGEELRPGGGYWEGRAVVKMEGEGNELAAAIQVLLLGLGDGGVAGRAPDRRVPCGGRRGSCDRGRGRSVTR